MPKPKTEVAAVFAVVLKYIAKNHPQLTALDALREVAKFSDDNCFNLTEAEFLGMAKQAWAERDFTS